MKLPTQTQGPVTLSKIDFAKNLSQETYAFTAVISIEVDGKTIEARVHNDGCGGPNSVYDRAVDEALAAYCKTLPEVTLDGVSFPVSVDYFISDLVSSALVENDLKRILSKKTLIIVPNGTMYTYRTTPTPEIRAAISKKHPTATVLNDLQFTEALKLYAGVAQ